MKRRPLPLPNGETVKRILHLFIEGKEEKSHQLIRQSIIPAEIISAEDRGLHMIKEGLKPSLDMTTQELDSLYSAYCSLAVDSRVEGCYYEYGPLQHVANAYKWSKENETETDLLEAIDLWERCLEQMQLAKMEEFDGIPDFDLTEYESVLLTAESDHIVTILVSDDAKQEFKFSEENDLRAQREIAKSFCKRVEKAKKQLEERQPKVPCMADFRITANIWRIRWQDCSKAIARSSKAKKRQA